MPIAVIYKIKLKPDADEALYKECWRTIATYFVNEKGAIGSVLHKSDDGLWYAYSRWPDLKTRDAAWPGEDEPDDTLPQHIKDTIAQMKTLGSDEKFPETCLEVVEDLLIK